MEELAPGKSLRFRLDGGEGRRSSVWSVFSAKKTADVYVSPRIMGGEIKLSFHQSGSWQVGFTEQSATASWTHAGSRHWEIWKRPPPLSPGITRAWYLFLPDGELRVGPGDPKARILPPIGVGFAASVEFLLVANLGETIVFDDAVVLARLALATCDESLLIVARRIPWGAAETAMADRWRARACSQARAAGVDINLPECRLYVHGHNADGVRFGAELAPG